MLWDNGIFHFKGSHIWILPYWKAVGAEKRALQYGFLTVSGLLQCGPLQSLFIRKMRLSHENFLSNYQITYSACHSAEKPARCKVINPLPDTDTILTHVSEKSDIWKTFLCHLRWHLGIASLSSICLSVRQSVRPSIRPSVRLSVCPCVTLFTLQ